MLLTAHESATRNHSAFTPRMSTKKWAPDRQRKPSFYVLRERSYREQTQKVKRNNCLYQDQNYQYELMVFETQEYISVSSYTRGSSTSSWKCKLHYAWFFLTKRKKQVLCFVHSAFPGTPDISTWYKTWKLFPSLEGAVMLQQQWAHSMTTPRLYAISQSDQSSSGKWSLTGYSVGSHRISHKGRRCLEKDEATSPP